MYTLDTSKGKMLPQLATTITCKMLGPNENRRGLLQNSEAVEKGSH